MSLLICEGDGGKACVRRQGQSEGRGEAGRKSREAGRRRRGQQSVRRADRWESSVVQVAQTEGQALRIVEAREEVISQISGWTVGEEGAVLVAESERQSW